MGAFRVPIEVGDLQGRRYVAVQALVDTGATYLTLPPSLVRELRVQALEHRLFRLADEREVEYEVGMVSLRIDERTIPVLCVFGPEGIEPLLGAVALETFQLGVDPVAQRLVPVPGLLKAENPCAEGVQ
jgi:clan AA aspartic protease